MSAFVRTVDNDDISEWTVRTLVRDRCSSELEEHYVQLNNILVAVNFPVHLDELDLILSQVNSQAIDVLEIVPSVDEVLRMAVERALANVGIEFQPEIPIEMLEEAADIILKFDPTDTPSILVGILDDSRDAEDGAIQLLVQLGTFEYERWMEQILEVHDGFCKNVRNVCTSALDSGTVVSLTPGIDGDLLKRLSRLVKTNGDTVAAELVAANTGIGASMESLYGCHVGRFLDLPVDRAVTELYSLAVISGESFEQAQKSISASLDDLFYESDNRRIAEQVFKRTAETFKPIFGGSDE